MGSSTDYIPPEIKVTTELREKGKLSDKINYLMNSPDEFSRKDINIVLVVGLEELRNRTI